jgi:hypothetical protein
MILYKYNDGSVIKLMSAKELISVPVWKGNRILDKEHASKIKEAIGNDINRLDSGYTIIKYNEETSDGRFVLSSYLIDGQHRAHVVRDYYNSTICEPDFQLTITEKFVESESDAIEYFNSINNTKPQHWKTDPNLLINNYIRALETHFNKGKKSKFIRSDATKRPYLSVTSLRDAFNNNIDHLKYTQNDIQKFIQRVDNFNKNTIERLRIELLESNVRDEKMKERIIDLEFSLAYDTKIKWVSELLI